MEQKKSKKKPLVRKRNFGVTLSAVLCGVAIVIVAVVLVVASSKSKDQVQSDFETKIPQMWISLSETPIEMINAGAKTVEYGGNTMSLVMGGEETRFENVEIKGRGNSTWGQIKKPYRIKLEDKADLFGLGKARKWVLLANYLDDSFLRNDLAFYLERMLDDEYARDGEFIELYIDGLYYGLYYVTRATEISKTMVDLRDPMGIIVELDNLYDMEEGSQTKEGNYLIVKDLVADDNEEEAFAEFMESFEALELAAKNGNYKKVVELADLESFAKYYLVNEFSVNPDAYASSFFMHKDGSEDKIHAGPGWDFDFAFGNRKWVWAEGVEFHSPTQTRVMEEVIFASDGAGRNERLMYYLMKMPEFEELVKKIFMEQMSGKGQEMLSYLAEHAKLVEEVAIKDGERWKKDAYFEEVEYLMDWIRQRYEYFEEVYGGG